MPIDKNRWMQTLLNGFVRFPSSYCLHTFEFGLTKHLSTVYFEVPGSLIPGNESITVLNSNQYNHLGCY